MSSTEQDQMQQKIDLLPLAFKDVFNTYLQAAKETEAWLSNFPKELEWLLKLSPSEILQTAAFKIGKPFEASRVEPTDTIGELILEIVSRRYTAVDALIKGEEIWGSGWSRWGNEEGKKAASSSVNELVQAAHQATSALLEALLKTDPSNLIEQKKQAKTFTPVEIVQKAIAHEERHRGMRLFFDHLMSTPNQQTKTTPMEQFNIQTSDWFTTFPPTMTWILDYSPSQILQYANQTWNNPLTPKIGQPALSIGEFMLTHSQATSQPEVQDYFRCIFDLIQAPFPESYLIGGKTTPLNK